MEETEKACTRINLPAGLSMDAEDWIHAGAGAHFCAPFTL
jgi:hypothetical protein